MMQLVPVSVSVYLREGARGLPDLPDHPQRDADHGGQGHEPANTVTPVRVGVHVVVLQRFVLDQEKQENCLRQTQQAQISFWGKKKKICFYDNKKGVVCMSSHFPIADCTIIYIQWIQCVQKRLTAQMPGVRIIQHHLMKKTGLQPIMSSMFRQNLSLPGMQIGVTRVRVCHRNNEAADGRRQGRTDAQMCQTDVDQISWRTSLRPCLAACEAIFFSFFFQFWPGENYKIKFCFSEMHLNVWFVHISFSCSVLSEK